MYWRPEILSSSVVRIRSAPTAPAAGSAGLDYECDPEDEKWLDRFNGENQKKTGKSVAPLKVEVLEDLLDRACPLCLCRALPTHHF